IANITQRKIGKRLNQGLLIHWILRQHKPGIDETAILAYFEMQVCALRVAGAASRTDPLTRADARAHAHTDTAQVGIEGRIAIPVIDLNDVAISIVIATLRHGDDTAIGSIHRCALAGSDIDAKVPRPVIIARNGVIIRRPYKRSASNRAA